MLRQLPSYHDNGQGMVMYSSGMKHALSVAIASSQSSEHGNVFLRYETCSESCHRLIVFITLSIDFSDAQGQLTPKSVMESCQNLNSSKLLWLVLLSARM